MQLLEAKTYIGKLCSIRWQERSGEEKHIVSRIHDVAYVPFYGAYLVTDSEEVRLDRVLGILLVAETPEPAPVREYQFAMKMAA